MSIHLSKHEIIRGYNGVKRLAVEAFSEGDIKKSLQYVRHCSVIAQQFNWIYADDQLEDLLAGIADKTIDSKRDRYEPIENRVVFYDDFCTSFVLALQYIRALVKANKRVLYITLQKKAKFKTILDEIRDYDNLDVLVIPHQGIEQRINTIYNAMVDFQPKQVLLHMYAYSAVLPALYKLPSAIERYIINLADQTFWLGKKAIDYSLEFRQFGASVSLQKRGLESHQLLMVPFYPILDENEFEGFPEQCTPDKTVIFSGGDLYKVLDRKKTWWKLVKRILDEHPDVVFLFATKINRTGTSIINRFIADNHFEGRFIHLPFRKDINEVFKHCDIYMGTCPASGSLMSQLAAINGKPILQYYYPGTPDDETEQAICPNHSFPISFTDEDAFLEEAHQLILDPGYRIRQGQRLREVMITPEQFDGVVMQTLLTKRSCFPVQNKSIDFNLLDERWLSLEREGYINTLPYIYGVLGRKNCLRFTPTIFVKKQLIRIALFYHGFFSPKTYS